LPSSFWFYCSEKYDDNLLPSPSSFFFGFVTVKKAMAIVTIAFFYGFVATKKATTTTFVAFFFMFKKKKTTAMNRHFLLWFYCNEQDDGTKLLSPSSVVVLQKIRRK
jgi:hypothetical protein